MTELTYPPIAKVALDVPLRSLFDYIVTTEGPVPQEGMRVRVSFGERVKIGFIAACSEQSDVPAHKLKPLIAILDETPCIPADILRLCRWAADYYHAPLGAVLAGALPTRLRQGHPMPETKTDTALAEIESVRQQGHDLNQEQQTAVEHIVAALGQFKAFVLDGITGSGKTEVYLQAIAKALEQRLQVLVLVPEIGLTPQMIARFTDRFAAPITLLHSRLTEKQRLHNWLLAAEGKAQIVIGTRSSVWAVMPRLGLIIVDEAHDGSYKQQDGVHYSARDVAVQRAYQNNIPVVLGSATHSLETLYNVTENRFTALSLRERAGAAQLGRFKVLDIRNERLQEGLSTRLIKEIAARMEKGEQSLLFLNRRGFSPILICHHCGWVAPCPHCDSYMTLHLSPQRLHCHHCNTVRDKPTQCLNCLGDVLMPVGLGTERIEAVLKKAFPNTEVLRIDKDTTRKKGSMEAYLEAIHDERYLILIGTQMLAKGHHFSNVTLVAIIDADSGLFSSEFRATENLAQLIVQVAGRAGRAEKSGEIWIQTRHPEHPLLTTLLAKGYPAFAEGVLTERKEAQLPPYTYMAIIRVQGPKPAPLQALLNAAKLSLSVENSEAVRCLGPAPSPMEKRDKVYHYQLLLWSYQRAQLHQALAQLTHFLSTAKNARAVRWSVDVDPYDTF
jgi:primosomal protein N' (replication factor Y)